MSYANDSVLAVAPWDKSPDGGPRITRIRTFRTAPDGIPLLVARIETDEPGLYGLGCASTPQRPLAADTVLTEYLDPILRGRRVFNIEDIHQLVTMSGYWRGGAIENNALAGVDIALWDLKARSLGVPVHQLLGGRVRTAVPVYSHAFGRDIPTAVADVQRLAAAGYRHIRCQVSVPGVDAYGAEVDDERARSRDLAWDSRPYTLLAPQLFEAVRSSCGPDLQLLHDAHERLTPPEAVRLARDLEPYRLFFLEDPLRPEDVAWLREIRAGSTTPLAMGEVFSDLRQFVPLIEERLIDFARIRVGAVGGITATRKLAVLCELHGVRLALHGPGDWSPIGHRANIAIDASSAAFGIQESIEWSDAAHDVFPGTPVSRDGAYEITSEPGLGVDFDEKAAALYPYPEPNLHDRWALLRRADGSVAAP